MAAGMSTPLLDFFRRGEVARDVRLLAAEGALAPRALEQLGILALLTADSDPLIREITEKTLAKLPANLIADFIARADVPTELRDFFVRRGIAPSNTPSPDFDEPLIDENHGEGNEEEKELTFQQRLTTMTVPEKVRYAMRGTREMRAQLIRDPNRLVAAAVLSCPKVNEAEVETFAKMGNVSEDILRAIATTRAWTKNYGVLLSLVKNAKTPVALSLNLMQRLIESDVKKIAADRNVPEPLRLAARKRVVAAMTR